MSSFQLTQEEKQNFVDAVDAFRAEILEYVAFNDKRAARAGVFRKLRVDVKLAKQVASRFECKDPLGEHEHDQKFNDAVEIYAKSLNMAQDLLRAPGHEGAKPKLQIASAAPVPPKGTGSQATAADSTTPPGELSAANSDTAAVPGEAAAAVSAPSAKADDASVVRTLAPVFARYKNGAHA